MEQLRGQKRDQRKRKET